MLQCLVEWGLTAKLACLAHQSGKLVQQKVVPASSPSLEDAQILGIYCPIRRSHAETARGQNGFRHGYHLQKFL
jgi:hypothetical protein